jgi:hypothetical protein
MERENNGIWHPDGEGGGHATWANPPHFGEVMNTAVIKDSVSDKTLSEQNLGDSRGISAALASMKEYYARAKKSR